MKEGKKKTLQKERKWKKELNWEAIAFLRQETVSERQESEWIFLWFNIMDVFVCGGGSVRVYDYLVISNSNKLLVAWSYNSFIYFIGMI